MERPADDCIERRRQGFQLLTHDRAPPDRPQQTFGLLSRRTLKCQSLVGEGA